MFTGLVEVTGVVESIETLGPGVRLRIATPSMFEDVEIGDSVSVSGCCLTVVSRHGSVLGFDAGEETLRRTVIGEWAAGSRANLERSLRVGDRMGGHFVSGHVDCVGVVDGRTDDDEWSTFWFQLPGDWMRHLVPKGCISVDGVSLTVVDVEASRFSVVLIPHTLSETTLGDRKSGDGVNVETDLLFKYVERSQTWSTIEPR